MQVLVTGGFGNVGISTVNALLSAGHRVCIFEHPSAKKRSSKRLRMLRAQHGSRFVVFYGDITDTQAIAAAFAEGFCFDRPDSLSDAASDPSSAPGFAVVHLAGVIPPLTDRSPDLAERINVGGTRALISACRALPEPPRLVFASSIALYGDRLAAPWISVSDPLRPNDPYSLSKQACEALVKESQLEWTILRLSYVVSSDWLPFDRMMFEVPPQTRLEVIHTEDAGRAFASACSEASAAGRIFNIGGGPACRTIYRAYLDRLMRCFGLGNSSFLPDELFAKGHFHCGWFIDSDEAEKVLRFRSKTLEDYYSEVQWRTRFLRPALNLAGWAARPWIRSLSPYKARKSPVRSPQFV